MSILGKREIYKIYLSKTIRSVALSVIGIYVPIYLLILGYSLTQTILFFIILHVSGLIFLFTILIPLMNRYGLIKSFKLHLPLQIIYLLLLHLLATHNLPIYSIAVIGGVASFIFHVPLNILLLKHSQKETLGTDLSLYLAIPKIAGIVGPLLSALLIPFVGFWPIFIFAITGLIISFFPLTNITGSSIFADIKFTNLWIKLKERGGLFVLEGFDNILEESEWFWGIFVYLIIGTLAAPGIIGSLEALGSALFMVMIGKYANKYSTKLTFLASLGVIATWCLRFFVESEFFAYSITLIASFIITAFLVSYFTLIYKEVKDDKEEEFLILREIPTVLGRLVLFGAILLSLNNLEKVFLVPIPASVMLIIAILIFRNKNRLKLNA